MAGNWTIAKIVQKINVLSYLLKGRVMGVIPGRFEGFLRGKT